MSRIKVIIWDLDGVLIDSKDWHFEALNEALQLFGYLLHRKEHLSIYDGLPTRLKLDHLSADQGLPTELHPVIINLKQRFTLQYILRDCKPNPILLATLDRLRKEGFRMAVASNAIRRSVNRMLECSGIMPYIEFSLSNEDVSRPKPYPEIYLKAVELLQCRPEQCLVVEDHLHGVQAATAAGTRVLQVASTAEVEYGRVKASIDYTK